MRRLSRVEYGYSVHDLFGYTASVSDSLPPEQFGNDGFDNYAQHANIDQLRADKIFGVAENVAASAAAAEVARLPCLTTSSDAACVRRFITTVGRKVYRRPLDEPEIATLEMLYQAGADLSVEARVTNVVHAMLVSPQFIFRAEAAGSSRPVARDPYELATRLSYLL